MENNPFNVKEPPAILKTELNARRDVTAANSWFASRSNWVSITSMCGAEGCDKVLASFQSKYGYEDEQLLAGKRPNPVVTSVKVASSGTIGSTRKATINILAFTEAQLNYITECFLRSDMSVRVEFGWSIAAHGSIAPGPIDKNRKLTDSQAICLINQQRESNPCYDGLQGRVGKWRINFNKDGKIWEIQIDLMASSTPVLNLPVQDFRNPCNCEQKQVNDQGETETSKSTTSRFKANLQELIRIASEDIGASEGIQKWIEAVDPKGKAYAIHLNGALRDELGGSPGWFDSGTSFFSKLGSLVPFNTEECEEAYITLETFFKCIQKLSLTQAEDTEGSIYCTFDLSSVSKAAGKGGGPVHSSDPHICLIPGGDSQGGDSAGDVAGAVALGVLAGFTGIGLIAGGTALAAGMQVGEGYKGIDEAESCLADPDGYVDLGKLLVNVIFIHKCLNELGKNATIQDLVDKVLNGINEAVGNLWELAVVDHSVCDGNIVVPNIVVIDLNTIKPNPQPYEIKITSFEEGGRVILPSLVRDIKMELQLSSAMQAQALYADTRTESTEDKCNQIRLKSDQEKYPNLAAPKPKDPEQGSDTSVCGENCDQETDDENPLDKLNKAYENLRDEISEGNKSTMYTNIIKYYNQAPEEDQCKAFILPFEVGLTFDGIGGFSYGQIVSIDGIPEKYQGYMYQIIAVEHDVTYGDWTTTLKMVPRPKST